MSHLLSILLAERRVDSFTKKGSFVNEHPHDLLPDFMPQPTAVRKIFIERARDEFLDRCRDKKFRPHSDAVEDIARAICGAVSHRLRFTEQGWYAWQQWKRQKDYDFDTMTADRLIDIMCELTHHIPK